MSFLHLPAENQRLFPHHTAKKAGKPTTRARLWRSASLQIAPEAPADRAALNRLSVAVFRALLNFDLHPV